MFLVDWTQKILGDYENWLSAKNTQQGRLYKESFEKRWSSLIHENSQKNSETYELLKKGDQAGYQVIENFSSSAVSKSFEQEVRETVSLEFLVNSSHLGFKFSFSSSEKLNFSVSLVQLQSFFS